MKPKSNEDVKIIRRNNLEDYKRVFYGRYEKSEKNFLEFLYFENDNFKEILKSSYKETVNLQIEEDEDFLNEKQVLYVLFGETLFKILNDIKHDIFNLKFYSYETIFEFVDDILSFNNIDILDDLYQTPVPYKVDRLVEFLQTYVSIIYIPELFIKENKIVEFLNLEIIKEEIKIRNKSFVTENSQNHLISTEIINIEETPEEKDAKVKFIILKEFGIIDLLISKNYNNADIGKILEPITKIKKSYIENILTADFQFPNTTKDKTAYKRKNILRALNEFEKIGIDFDQLKYLPEIKRTEPHLFE